MSPGYEFRLPSYPSTAFPTLTTAHVGSIARDATLGGIRMFSGTDWVHEAGEVVNVKGFGVIGDRTSHPLSERYATLSAAQVDYPHALALTDEIDWAAIQGALNSSLNNDRGVIVEIPKGHYYINRGLTSRQGNLTLRGLGAANLTISQFASVVIELRAGANIGFDWDRPTEDVNVGFRSPVIENIMFWDSSGDKTHAVRLQRFSGAKLRNVVALNFQNGIGFEFLATGSTQADNLSLYDVNALRCRTGIRGNDTNNMRIFGGVLQYDLTGDGVITPGTKGIELVGSSELFAFGLDVQNGWEYGIDAPNAEVFHFYGRLEGFGTGIRLGTVGACRGPIIEAHYSNFILGGSTGTVIELGGFVENPTIIINGTNVATEINDSSTGFKFLKTVTGTRINELVVSGSGGKDTLDLSSTDVDTGLTIGGDVNFYRAAANLIRSDDQIGSLRSLAILTAFGALVSGDTLNRFLVRADGNIEWGDGTNPPDVSLSRSAANELRLADADNLAFGTTSGTKIGTSTAQKLAFYNKVPVIQPAAISSAAGGATVDAEARTAINTALDRLRDLGLIST